jgi:hypothetical protein
VKHKLTLCLVWLTTASMWAQDIKCPITITLLRQTFQQFNSNCQHDKVSPCVEIKYENTTDKTITGAKFRVQELDAVGDGNDLQAVQLSGNAFNPQFNPIPFVSDKKVEPTKEKTAVWHVRSITEKQGNGWSALIGKSSLPLKAWPEKIAFVDGTTWENTDNGCTALSVDAKKGK